MPPSLRAERRARPQPPSHTPKTFSSVKGPIQLCSGHKAKGLEWDTVFHLDPWRVPSKFAKKPEDQEQELNIRYVIETSPKDSLFLTKVEDFV